MALLILFTSLMAITIASVYYLYTKTPPIPDLDFDAWWSPNELKTKQDFKVKFDDKMIADLRSRLKNHRKLTPPLEGVAFDTNQLDSWVSYWADQYDFKAREAALNKYPQFKTNIQGLDIHFIRVKPESPGKEVVPMLLLHGYPGSVREFHDAIPLLTAVAKDRDFTIEVIIPSLVGYGFSDVSVAMADSPVGLLAYVLEKFSPWTNKYFISLPDGGLNKKFTREQLIDNLMFYWAANSATTAFRLYAENFNVKQMGYRVPAIPTPVPTWVIEAEHELAFQPAFILRFKYPNLLNTTIFQDGGHFLAFEMPGEFSENVLIAVGEFRKFHSRNAKAEL